MNLATAIFATALFMISAPAFAQSPQAQPGPMPGRMGPSGATPMMQGGMIGPGGQMLMSTGQMPMMGMMGPGMMPMIMSPAGMMGGMMGSPDYVEGRLAFLKTELKITDAQMPQWNAFADALRANAKRISDLRNEMIGSPGIPMIAGSALERFERMEKFLSSHLESVRTMKAALQPLYAVLSDDQKKTTDALIYSPMGMM